MDFLSTELVWGLGIGVAIWLCSICYRSDHKDADAEELKRENEKEQRVA